MKAHAIFVLTILTIGLGSCRTGEKDKKADNTNDEISPILNPANSTYQAAMTGYDTTVFHEHYEVRIEPPKIDLNQSLNNKSISELVILKNTLLAMKGEIFKDAIYANYFKKMPWYQPPFWDQEFIVNLTNEESQFVNRIDEQIKQLLQNNFLEDNMANPDNSINAFQWSSLDQKATEKLKTNGFVMIPGNYNQFLDVYHQNQDHAVPSFISTDLILHQMHLFYGILENEIEEDYLIDILKEMLENINIELYAAYEKTLDPQVEKAIEENLLYYSIPYAVISEKKNNLIGNYNQYYVDELTKVLNAEGIGSEIMGNDQLDYKIFKPHGQYTKNEKTEKYYQALTWLQKINLCLNNENEFKKAIIVAYIINKSDALKKQYAEYVELKTYFSSQPEQFTLWDLAKVISTINEIRVFDDLFQEQNLTKIRKKLWLTDQSECKLSVSLMPIEYQNLYTNLNQISRKDTEASSLDLFAALANPAAKSVLNQSMDEGNDEYLASIIENLLSISRQEEARSMDWLSTLLTSFNEHHYTLTFMNNDAWKRKELNAISGSWIQLNQRVNLSVGNIKKSDPDPQLSEDLQLKGFVEPNPNFWSAASILLENTKVFFLERNRLSKKSAENLVRFQEMIYSLFEISEKEIAGSNLTQEDYAKINAVPDECMQIILNMLNPNYSSKSMSITTNMAYATNVFHSSTKKYIFGGIGPACVIIVPVEIGGYVYLTKGAVYSYYEVPNHHRSGISQAQWLQMLKGDTEPIAWMQDLFVPTKDVEEQDELLAAATN